MKKSANHYKNWISYLCIALAIGVILGAFGAHALRDKLSLKLANSYETAVRYWFFMHLAMLGLVALTSHRQLTLKSLYLLVVGAWLFSVSIWLYVFSGFNSFAIVTPLGGLALVAGFIWAAWEVKKHG